MKKKHPIYKNLKIRLKQFKRKCIDLQGKKYIVLGNKGIIKASNIFKDSDLYYKFSTTKN